MTKLELIEQNRQLKERNSILERRAKGETFERNDARDLIHLLSENALSERVVNSFYDTLLTLLEN